MNSYIENFKVKTYETDHNGRFKPSFYMYHMQEMANIHALSLGFGYDNLVKAGIAWVLSRVHIRFMKLPVWKDEITMETWHKGSDRLFGFRDYRASDKDGNTIIMTTSSWLIINLNTRRVQRMDSVLTSSSNATSWNHAIETPAERLITPPGMVFKNRVKVSLSDIDINQHTNNVRYLEWAINSIDTRISSNMFIEQLWINFNNECRLNDEIDIYVNEDNPVFVEGKRDGTSIFQVKIAYSAQKQ